jgi:hypothetical protein
MAASRIRRAPGRYRAELIKSPTINAGGEKTKLAIGLEPETYSIIPGVRKKRQRIG